MATKNVNLIQAYVTNKFANSQYIKERKYPDPLADIKYFPEEIAYWVKQIVNSNWELSVFDAEFEATYSIDHNRSLSTAGYNDHIGQTFFIDEKTYPNGMFLSSISVFVRQEATNETVTLDVRKLVNGVPADIIPLSKVVIVQGDQPRTFGWDINDVGVYQPSERKFTFDFPVFLSPGNYCFTLRTNSFDFSVFVSENGKAGLNSDKVVVNPYIGDFIYSNQGTSWVTDPTRDMCFILNQAIFNIGESEVLFNTGRTAIGRPIYDFDTVTFATATKEFDKIAYIKDSKITSYDYNTSVATEIPAGLNSNIDMPSHSKIDPIYGVPFKITLKNTDKNLTPIIDIDATCIKFIKNHINAYTQEISDSELTPKGGGAFAKYISKPVTLNEDFDADGITLYVDVNTPIGTSIEVFYRVLNRYDNDLSISDTIWYRLTKKSSAVPSLLASDYIEELYEDLNITYSGINGVRYDSFNRLQVKIVFYSDEQSKIPSIKNLRVIATV